MTTSATTATSSCSNVLLRQISDFNVGTRFLRKSCLCELALWVQGWQTRGDLVSFSDSRLLTIDPLSLSKVLIKFPTVLFEVCMYVRGILLEVTSKDATTITDQWRSNFIVKEVAR